MSSDRNHGVNVVRPPISWKAHKAFYVFVFLVTGVLIYQWGWLKADRNQPAGEYTATASVRHDIAATLPGTDKAARASVEDIRRQILSAANVGRAIRELDASAALQDGEDRDAAVARMIAEAQEGLSLEVTENGAADRVRVAITANSPQPQFAMLLVNTLAGHYAADCRVQGKAAAQEAYLAVRGTAERAERELTQAQSRLDAFEKEMQQRAAHASAEPKPVRAAEPKPVEDPQWTELNAQLTRLRQQRAALLIERTPAHPAVQEAELRIAETQRLLDATPQWSTAPQSPTPASKQPAVAERSVQPTVPPAAETVRQLQQLRDAVAKAAQVNETAVAAERRARQACEREPAVDVQLARTSEATAAEGGTPGAGLLFASLLVGLVAAAGVCLVGAGVSIEPTVNSIAELESLLGTPIVGAVPADGSGVDLADTARRRQITRWTLIGVGGVVLVICVLLARWTLGG